jgi:hypothetical protein
MAHGFETLPPVQGEHMAEKNLLIFNVHFLRGLLRGDAGRSVVFAQVVCSLTRRACSADFSECNGTVGIREPRGRNFHATGSLEAAKTDKVPK